MRPVHVLLAAAGLLPTAPAAPQQRQLAVVVGIDTYHHADRLAPLGLAEADARDFAAVLRAGGFAVEFLLPGLVPPRGSSPRTADDILQAVARMAAQAGPDDTILFFYSGHGFSDPDGAGYLCTMGTDPERLHETALRLDEVLAAMRASAAGRRIAVLDACRNVVSRDVAPERRLRVEALEAARGLAVLFSTSPGELSFEPTYGMRDASNRVIRNGLFTHHLLWGVRGDADLNRDGLVSLRETEQHVVERLRGLQTSAKQEPVCFLDGERGAADLLLCRVLGQVEVPGDQPIAEPTILVADPSIGADAPFEAIALEPRSRYSGTVGEGLDRSDWFKLQVDRPGVLHCTVRNTSAESGKLGAVRLCDHTGATLWQGANRGLAGGREFALPAQCLRDYLRYYIEVQGHPAGDVASYELTTRFEPLVQEDVGEPNHVPERATPLDANGGVTAWVGRSGDEVDHYAIQVEQNGRMRVELRNLMPAGTEHANVASISIRRNGVAVVPVPGAALQPTRSRVTDPFSVEAGADYLLVVTPADPTHTVLYQIITSFTPLETTDSGEADDHSRSNATLLIPGQARDATIGFQGDLSDWWRVDLQRPGYVRIDINNLHERGVRDGALEAPILSDGRLHELFRFPGAGIRPARELSSPLLPIAGGDSLFVHCQSKDGPGAVPYRIRAEVVDLPIAAEAVPDGDDAPQGATVLALGTPLERSVGFGDDPIDWYRVRIPQPGSLQLTIANLSPGQCAPALALLAQVELRDAAGAAVLGKSKPSRIGAGKQAGLSIALNRAGDYLVRIRPEQAEGAAPYRLDASFQPAR